MDDRTLGERIGSVVAWTIIAVSGAWLVMCAIGVGAFWFNALEPIPVISFVVATFVASPLALLATIGAAVLRARRGEVVAAVVASIVLTLGAGGLAFLAWSALSMAGAGG